MASRDKSITGLNPNTAAFDMTAMNAAATAAAYAVSGGDAHLPEFSIEKPEVGSLWWKLCLRTATSRSQKKRYNWVLYVQVACERR
jgi:hypothetical protein